MGFHEVLWNSMRFYDVLVNRSVPTEANRGLTSYINPDVVSTIWCDNQQTVGIVTKAEEKLQTKLKHVDIHQLWLRQEVEAERLYVDWKPTAYMPADGLTKVLPQQKHAQFIKQLGLEDVSDRLITTTKDINNESLLETHD
jgi:hypothetical protein